MPRKALGPGKRRVTFKTVPKKVSEDQTNTFVLNAMEPRARVGRNRGQQNFSDLELQHFLFAHGDTSQSLESTKKVLDEILTEFITELCFEAHRAAQLAGRQKIKVDDIKWACRKNSEYLGKIEETQQKKINIEAARKLLDQNDDKITKSNVKGLEEEPLGDADDDMDLDAKTVGAMTIKINHLGHTPSGDCY